MAKVSKYLSQMHRSGIPSLRVITRARSFARDASVVVCGDKSRSNAPYYWTSKAIIALDSSLLLARF